MVCFHPIKAFYPLFTNEDGKRYLKFGRSRYLYGVESMEWLWKQENDINYRFSHSYDSDNPIPVYYSYDGEEIGLNIQVPCGKCLGCRLDYARNWAIRSTNEAYMHNHFNNCAFLTLTFNDDMLLRRENPYSLSRSAFTSWIKRLRKAIKSQYNTEIRIMACGEYGSKHKRPHYHMLVYGFDFPDKYIYKYNKFGKNEVFYYRSDFLENVWRPAHCSDSYGFSIIGDVNFESSAYVARYCTKKLFGAVAEKVYKSKEPEFLTTSRNKGLGYDYFKKFYREFVPRGYIMTTKGFKAPIPRYYINCLKEIDSKIYNDYMISSFNKMCDNLLVENKDSTKQRLLAREELKRNCMDRLIRCYEFNGESF